MDSQAFALEVQSRVLAFCHEYDERLPAYSFVPLTDDQGRVKVMKSRLWNEVRAAEVFGSWLKTTPEMEVKTALGEAVAEEFQHAVLLRQALSERRADPDDYRPLPAQVAMFNAFEAQMGTVERMAAFPLAGEGVADYMIQRCIEAGSVPDWVTAPYRTIHADEEAHGSFPAEVIGKYATTEDQQEAVWRAIEMSLALRRQYFDNLDRWVFEDRVW